jgi:hypothetical protein
MHLLTTNKLGLTFDVYRFAFESAGAPGKGRWVRDMVNFGSRIITDIVGAEKLAPEGIFTR